MKRKTSQTARFCRCIKHVRKTIKARRGTAESAAIGTCVKSVLQRRGKTLKRFRCGKKPILITQKPLRGGGGCPCNQSTSQKGILNFF